MRSLMRTILLVLPTLAGTACLAADALPAQSQTQWTHAGWGGGGYYYAAAFHPTRDGVIYLAGDVGGVYKSEDHGRSYRMINNGLVNYGVFTLAVDAKNPQTVYAATEGGLCKSTDAGERWQVLPQTGRKELRITGEKGKSIRSVAVDSTDGNIVYAASPAGKVFKSTDGGQTWNLSWQKAMENAAPDSLRVQYGKTSGAYFGGMWIPLAFPTGGASADCVGFGFSFMGGGAVPRDCYLTLKTSTGATYRTRNISEIFKDQQWRDVIYKAGDFSLDGEYVKKNPEKAKEAPATPDWATVNRLDFTCVGSLPEEAYVARFGKFFFAMTKTADGQAASADKPALVTVRDFAKSKSVQTYGNVRTGDPAGGSVYSVAVSAKDPSFVLAATNDAGLIASSDAGKTWRELPTPKKASSVAVAPSDANIVYASFFTDGVWKSLDKGVTWSSTSKGLSPKFSAKEVAVSPTNPQDVYVIGADGWSGGFYFSRDGGTTWQDVSRLTPDRVGNPTLPQEPNPSPLSTPTNIAINPRNPQQLIISANWRSCLSEDGGKTWIESMKGADISCIYDIRFSGSRVYACAMDEGTLVSESNGQTWKQLWPLKWSPEISGHNWRLSVTPHNGSDRVIAACSPWDQKYPNRIILSQDGGKTYKIVTEGLPNYIPRPNTMWGQGYARALATDPNNPQVLYLGIDGDPSEGNTGGGVFKSADGGNTWKQLANQPGSRRMFFGLVVDPTDSNRLYWASCGDRGGLYRSDNGGESWQLVFKNDQWLFNVLVSKEGTVYAPGKQLWRSTDQGKTWKQLTKLTGNRTIVAMETHPTDPKTMWFTATTWDGSDDGGVYKTSDGGVTWQEITGDLPYHKPMVLRYNAQTGELWAGGVGLYRTKQ